MRSVAALRKWVAEQLQQFEGNSDVDYVLHYIRRNTDHPMYTDDPLLKPQWDKFLSSVNCRKIRLGRQKGFYNFLKWLGWWR